MEHNHALILYYSPLALAGAPGELTAVLEKLNLALKVITPGQAGQTVGHLAGLADFPALDGPTAPIPDPMLILCGLTQDRLDALLGALRAGGLPPIPYKAVLTAHNCSWTLSALYDELKSERAAIARGQKPT